MRRSLFRILGLSLGATTFGTVSVALICSSLCWDLHAALTYLLLTVIVPFMFCTTLLGALLVCRHTLPTLPPGASTLATISSEVSPRSVVTHTEGIQMGVAADAHALDSILLVKVAQLSQRLDEAAPELVLAELNDGDTLLQRRPLSACSEGGFALISYRQQRVPSDSFTLDSEALISVV